MKLSTPATVPHSRALGTPISASRAQVATPKTMLMNVLIRRYRDICCSISNIARLMRVRCVPLGKRYAIFRRNMEPEASRKNVRKTIVSTPLMACAVVQPTLASGPPPGVATSMRMDPESALLSPVRCAMLLAVACSSLIGSIVRSFASMLRIVAGARRSHSAAGAGSTKTVPTMNAMVPNAIRPRATGRAHPFAPDSSPHGAKQQRQQDGDGDGHEQAARELQRGDEQHREDPRHERDEEPRSKGDRTRWSSGPLGVDQLLYNDGKVSHVQPVNRVYQRWSALAPNPIAGTVPDRETPFGRPVLAGRRRVA